MTTNLASLLARSAATRPDHAALVASHGVQATQAGEHHFDYATVDLFARMFAGALRDLGVQPGQHVALVLPNVPQFTVAYFGCHYAGNPVVPLNVLLTADELAYHLEDSDAVAVVVWDLFLPAVQEAVAATPNVRHVVVAKADLADLSAPAGVHNLTALVAAATPVSEPHPTGPGDTAVVLYTSGTTGRPKGAELTHANLLANAEVAAGLVDLEPDTVSLAALPLFHAFGMSILHNAVLAVGGTVVLLPRFTAADAYDAMGRHRVTFFGGVPTMYIALLNHESASDRQLPALKWCVSGGAPMPAEVLHQFEARFDVTLLEGYGLSETSPVCSFTAPGRPRTPGSIGYPVPGVEMALLADDGRFVTTSDTPGEICVRGHNVMKGYWHNSEATAEAIVDGWFRTGDIGTRDVHGAYRIVDRKKDLIIRGGYNVYPREIEEALHQHPDVAQAAVVGVPHPRLGEEVKAVVVLKPGREASTATTPAGTTPAGTTPAATTPAATTPAATTPAGTTPAGLVAWCRRRLAAYKYPRIVEIRESLPLGPTGKVLKKELRIHAQPAEGGQPGTGAVVA